MKLIKLLPIAILFFLLGNVSLAFSPVAEDCDKVEVKLSVVNSSGASNGSVQVDLIKGDKRSAKFIFCDATGKVINEGDFKRQNQSGLKAGKYICIISTDDCSKKVEFIIE